MAEKRCKSKAMPPGRQQQESNQVVTEKEVVKVEFIITTYPELRPFLEMAVNFITGRGL